MSDGDERLLEDPWPPSEFALAFDRFDHPADQGRGSIVVSHPTAPFIRPFDGDAVDRDAALQRIAYDYLLALDERLRRFGHPNGLDLPAGWLDSLDPGRPNPIFGWLPIERPVPSDGLRLQLTSLHLLRRTAPPEDDGTAATDASFVLVGAETLADAGGVRPTNSDFGLQVFIHDRADGTAAISSMTANLPFAHYATLIELFAGAGSAAFSTLLLSLTPPPDPDDPGVPPSNQVDKGEPDDAGPAAFFNFERFTEIVLAKDAEIATLYQLRPNLVYDRLRFTRPRLEGENQPVFEIEVSGKGIGTRKRGAFTTPYRFSVTLSAISESAVRPVAKSVLVTDVAAGHARIFEQDPPSWRNLDDLHEPLECYDWSSRRPSRSEEQLDAFRRTVEISSTGNAVLEDPTTFAVRNCPDFVRSDPQNNDTKTVTLPADDWPPVRADDHSAISAYYNCLSLFTTMRGFGLDPVDYFRATEQPFDVFYRSGISPGPGKNGQTINARVALGPDDRIPPPPPAFLTGERTSMRMHMALANFSHRARWLPPDNAPTWAEPLGIATSERWTCHEFGHALIAGRLGQLELPFVHSVGDALAAVAADPLSRLAEPRKSDDPNCPQTDPDDRFDRFRGYTYPFVFITRRHDRCVKSGWSWGGTFHRPVIEAGEIGHDQLKGYISEQILSSTLFRLYRCLGGDTIDVEDGGPDYQTRRTASDVVIYLIMRGLQTFGMAPARAEELENALIQADVGLTLPLGTRTALEDAPAYTAGHDWTGGQAQKVIRWAFEAQGMHLPHQSHIRNDVGDPPDVDIYIPDLRPTVEKTDGGDVQHGPGGYVPVSLDWAGQPLWHAGDLLPDLSMPIVVRNRGSQEATNVSARAWLGWTDGDPATRGWDRTALIVWSPPVALTPATTTVAGGNVGQASFSIASTLPSPPPATRVFLLVEATCPDDRANSDPVPIQPWAIGPTGTPPAMPRAFADLVANDNNLGLWMLRL